LLQTVGYGDLTITNSQTRIFLAFYIIFSTILLSFAIQNFQNLRAERSQLKKIEKMTAKMKDLHFLQELDCGEGISEEQFVIAMLNHLGTLDYDRDITPWVKVTKSLHIECSCLFCS
jgi:hypothetical protein